MDRETYLDTLDAVKILEQAFTDCERFSIQSRIVWDATDQLKKQMVEYLTGKRVL